jgi:hypothetical protein
VFTVNIGICDSNDLDSPTNVAQLLESQDSQYERQRYWSWISVGSQAEGWLRKGSSKEVSRENILENIGKHCGT